MAQPASKRDDAATSQRVGARATDDGSGSHAGESRNVNVDSPITEPQLPVS